MQHTPPLSLPPPWRLFLSGHPKIETTGQAYKTLSQAFQNRKARLIPNEAVEVWNANQSAGTLNITFENGDEITSGFQFLGTYDGQTFMWGDANPSLQAPLTAAASKFRDWLKDKSWTSFQEDKFRGSLRDTLALLALAGEALEAENIFLAASGYNSYVALILEDVTRVKKPPAVETVTPQKQGLFSRFFKAPKADADAAKPKFEETNPFSLFDLINQNIANQVADNQPSEEVLSETEAAFPRIKALYDEGNYAQALNGLDALRPKLGTFIVDAEPAGWFFLCEAACHLELGQKEKARSAFAVAARAIHVPDYGAILLGNSRSAPDDAGQLSTLKACFIYQPDGFLKHATEAETDLISRAVNTADAKRSDEDADVKAVLNAAISELSACEKKAFALSQEASKHRTDSHVLCAQDDLATFQANTMYRDIVLAYFTMRRNPSLSSYSSDPINPNTYTVTHVENISESEASLTILTAKPDSLTYRYQLVKTAIPFSNTPLWRIDKIWSIWPDEEILLS